MTRHYLLALYAITTIGLPGCSSMPLEVDTQILQEKVYDPSVSRPEGLKQSTVLYFD